MQSCHRNTFQTPFPDPNKYMNKSLLKKTIFQLDPTMAVNTGEHIAEQPPSGPTGLLEHSSVTQRTSIDT